MKKRWGAVLKKVKIVELLLIKKGISVFSQLNEQKKEIERGWERKKERGRGRSENCGSFAYKKRKKKKSGVQFRAAEAGNWKRGREKRKRERKKERERMQVKIVDPLLMKNKKERKI